MSDVPFDDSNEAKEKSLENQRQVAYLDEFKAYTQHKAWWSIGLGLLLMFLVAFTSLLIVFSAFGFCIWGYEFKLDSEQFKVVFLTLALKIVALSGIVVRYLFKVAPKLLIDKKDESK